MKQKKIIIGIKESFPYSKGTKSTVEAVIDYAKWLEKNGFKHYKKFHDAGADSVVLDSTREKGVLHSNDLPRCSMSGMFSKSESYSSY